ncbi:retrotransposable element Tf2, partial [Tanacetum coccineum]
MLGSEEETTPHILLNALIGRNIFQKMRVIGHIGKYEIHILVDSGSTHNFIDCEIARKLGCQRKKTCPLQVTVANGNHMVSNSMCRVKSQLKNEEFCADMMVLPLRGCEMVLGIKWLSTLGIQSAPTVLKTLLEKYADVFAIPKELPPFRSHDHKIPLKEGTL